VERALQHVVAIGDEALRDVCGGCKRVEGVEPPRKHMELGRNTRLKEMHGIFDVLVHEQVELSHGNVRGRQARQVGGPKGCGIE
jgi:hypothetical protein